MTDLFNFPKSDERDWKHSESDMHEQMKKEGLNADIRNRVLNHYKPFWVQAVEVFNTGIVITGEFSEIQNQSIKADIDEYEKKLKEGVAKLNLKIFHLCVLKALDE